MKQKQWHSIQIWLNGLRGCDLETGLTSDWDQAQEKSKCHRRCYNISGKFHIYFCRRSLFCWSDAKVPPDVWLPLLPLSAPGYIGFAPGVGVSRYFFDPMSHVMYEGRRFGITFVVAVAFLLGKYKCSFIFALSKDKKIQTTKRHIFDGLIRLMTQKEYRR